MITFLLAVTVTAHTCQGCFATSVEFRLHSAYTHSAVLVLFYFYFLLLFSLKEI